jgi:hypothetical protein
MNLPPFTLTGHLIPASIFEAFDDPAWWGDWFDRGDWRAWRAFLAALFRLPLEGDALATYQECTGRTAAPEVQPREAWAICGRRAGKTRIMATVAAWLSCFVDWRPSLAPGEKATVMVLAADRKQARVAMRYLRALIVQHPLLKQLVKRETSEAIELNCGTIIEVATSSYRSTRGYSVAAVLADEVSFWFDQDGSANPASEIFAALRPAMATLPNSLLMVATTPYSRRGIVYETFRRHWGRDGDPILIWRAPTRAMNSSVPQSVVDEALEADRASASAEYLAEFRSDIETFLSPELIEAAVDRGVVVRRRLPEAKYHGFCDPSGGASDSFALAIAHREKDTVLLDALIERLAPFNPTDVVAEMAQTLREYGLTEVRGDRYAAAWPVAAFAAHGIRYLHHDKDRSAVYSDVLPLFTSGRLRLLDHHKLVSQFTALERRVTPTRDKIDHPVGGHDDLANACAGALTLAVAKRVETFAPAFVEVIPRTYPHDYTDGPTTNPARASGPEYRAGRTGLEHLGIFR